MDREELTNTIMEKVRNANEFVQEDLYTLVWKVLEGEGLDYSIIHYFDRLDSGIDELDDLWLEVKEPLTVLHDILGRIELETKDAGAKVKAKVDEIRAIAKLDEHRKKRS